MPLHYRGTFGDKRDHAERERERDIYMYIIYIYISPGPTQG